MLLTLTTTHRPAMDLGYLLHKNPAKLQTFDLSFGRAHVFYPEATAERCTAALLLDVDPVGLVRGRKGASGEGFALEQYVSDRPYAASSFLSVAIARVFGSALAGRSKGRQVLAASRRPLDSRFPAWGESAYFHVELSARCRLSDLLTHLYVLVPVLDDDKHYWVGEAEVEKLLRHGAGWLATHPQREAIAYRYLKHRRSLTRETLARLVEEDQLDPDEEAEARGQEEETLEKRISLNEERLGSVVAALKASEAKRVLDLGCGEGKLLKALLAEKQSEEITGLDVSTRTLERARDRLRLDQLPPGQRQRIRLIQGGLTYRDKRLQGKDAAAVVEVIEHLDPPRLDAFARALFECARPRTVVLPTSNAEYNVRFETLPAGTLRHKDHRFEWTRAEFQGWSDRTAVRFGYEVRLAPIGPHDPEVGSPTQMAVFTRPGGE